MKKDDMADTEDVQEASTGKRGHLYLNRRKHLRSVFTYPVEFKLFSQKAEGISFDGLKAYNGHSGIGYLKDISLGGAGLEIEDEYGRFNVDQADRGRVKLTLSVPREDKIIIFAHIQWAKKVEGTSRIKMGVSFKDLDYRDLTVIEKLIGLRNKDHNMMWNLWERYNQ
jgi:hypothetical protein